MEVPEWVWDEARPLVSNSALLVLLAIFRHGRRDVGSDGERRSKLILPVSQLAKTAGISKRSAEVAVRDLTALALLEVSAVTQHNAPRAFIARYECANSAHTQGADQCAESAHSAKIAHSPESVSRRRARDGGGVKDNSLIRFNRLDRTTTTPERAEIALWLEEEDVFDPDGWCERYGDERVWRVINRLDWARHTKRIITNPAGWMYTMLESSVDPPPARIIEQVSFAAWPPMLPAQKDVTHAPTP